MAYSEQHEWNLIKAANYAGVPVHRFVELRFDEDARTVTGVAMRYGDTAKMPWGSKERFEPKAFGEVETADVILNLQHDRSRMLARSDGGNLTLTDTPTELRIEAVIPETPTGAEAFELVRTKVLRGFSVEFIPDVIREDFDKRLVVVEAATLRGIGLVDKPAYTKSTVDKREGSDMDEAQIRTLVETLLAKQRDDGATTEATTEAIVESVRAQVDAALEERDTAQAEAAAADERAAKMKKKAADDEEEMQEKAERAAEERAALIVEVRDLLPVGTELRGVSNHEIMVMAVGDEVADAADRSADYLQAKIEGIVERRAKAKEGNRGGGKPKAVGPPKPVDITRMVEKRHLRDYATKVARSRSA